MHIIQSGRGKLIQPPDIEGFRAWNRSKPKAMFEKRMTKAEAVSRFIHPGD
ncbi:MAG TPA: hypothetical protein VJ436_13595 [Anaerolineales bacterium]|nr:hypothetical protein [Anaerolineales bacterium]